MKLVSTVTPNAPAAIGIFHSSELAFVANALPSPTAALMNAYYSSCKLHERVFHVGGNNSADPSCLFRSSHPLSHHHR